MVTLREIDRTNYRSVINLAVTKEQEEFIASNMFSLAQAKAQSECVPLAIYNNDCIVGFVMYCLDYEDKEYWIYRIMIDKNHQKKGYGKAAMQNVLDVLKADKEHNKVYLSFEPDNYVAKRFYDKLGFIPDGRVVHGEIVYCLHFTQ